MESLDNSSWDIVIAGTGLHESLLALALSRSDLKILHLDKNAYYGGEAAALNLEDAETWVENVNSASQDSGQSVFKNASVKKPDHTAAGQAPTTLGPPRRYSLALAPLLIYARPPFLSTLVSARVDAQLEFLALGNWWLYDADKGEIVKVPNGREDLFAEQSIDARSKRSLIKFLRFVVHFEQNEDIWRALANAPFSQFLEEKFSISHEIQQTLGGLAMTLASTADAQTEYCIRRIARHLRSLGVFGPNFGAVTPKYGGLAEIAQVACRSCAVGGATYILGEGVQEHTLEPSPSSSVAALDITLTTGDKVKAKHLVFGAENKPSKLGLTQSVTTVSRCIYVVSGSLERLFPSLGEDSPTPAGATVRLSFTGSPPVTIIVHTADTGECPSGQSVCYASILGTLAQRHETLDLALNALLTQVEPDARVLWSLQFEQQCPDELRPADLSIEQEERLLVFPLPSSDPVFEDEVLQRVRAAWRVIMGPDVDDNDFMKFERRGGEDTEET